ncbi:MAG: hypothetical protein WD178_10820 [Actinomycetota bacterium]
MTGERNAPSGRGFWLGLAAGWAVMLFGLAGLLDEAVRTHPASFGAWFVGSALVHDALIAPVAFALAFVIARRVPVRLRPFLRTGLILSAAVLVVAFPMIAGPGIPGNPSALPRNYPAGLAAILALIWVGTGFIFVLKLLTVDSRHD